LKYKDPDCLTISCFIREHKIERALHDLGASVNLLPYSVFQSLNLGELKPTFITLLLTDKSVKVNIFTTTNQCIRNQMTLEMNIFNLCKQPGDDNDLQEVDFTEKLVRDQFQTTFNETEIDEFDYLQMVYFQEESKTNSWRP